MKSCVRSMGRMTVGRTGIIAGLAFGLIRASVALGASDSWKLDANGNWNAAANWTGGNIPGSTTLTDSPDVATFSTALTATRTVTVDANRNISGITFGNTSTNGYTLSSGSIRVSDGGLIQTLAGTGNHNDIINPTITVQGDGGSATFRNNASGNTAGLQVGNITGVSTAGNTTTIIFDGVSTASGTGPGVRNNTSATISDGAGGGKVTVVKNGTGLWTMSAGSTYSGGLAFNAGTIRFFSSGVKQFGTGTITLTNGVTFNKANATVMSISNPMVVNGNFTLSGSAGCTWSGTMDLAGATRQITANATAEFSGVLSNGGLTKAGTGTLTLSGVNTYGGGTALSAGSLALSGSGTMGHSSGPLTVSGGALNLGGTEQAVGAVTVSGGAISNGTLTGTSYAAQTGTISAVLAGSGVVLTKTGANILTLSGANTYDGGTIMTAGTLVLEGAGTLGAASGSLTVSGGTLDLGGTSQTVGGVTISGGTVSNGTVTGSSYAGQAGAVSAVLAGSGVGLTKTTAGTLLLNGVNTYSGDTAVNEGTLGGSGTIAGAVTLASGASIAPGAGVGTLTLGGSLTLSGGGALEFEIYDESNADRLVVTGDLNPSGTTTISLPSTTPLTNGVYTLIEVAGTMGGTSNNFSVVSPSPLKIYSIGYESTPKRVVLTVVDDDSVLTWIGDGVANVWDTTAANWTNLVSGGALAAYADTKKVKFDSLGSANPVVDITDAVSPVYVIVEADTNYTFSGAGSIGGSCGLVKSGTGLLTVSNANSFSGEVDLQEGTLIAASGTALGTAAGGVQVGVGGTLALAGGITVGAEALSLAALAASGDSILRNVDGNNTWGGSITADTGSGTGRTRVISDAGNLLITGPVTTSGGQDFVVGGNGNGEISGVVSGSRPVFKSSSGTGTWTLSGNNTYLGGTTSANGNLAVTGSLTNNAGVSVNGAYGTSTALGGTLTVSGAMDTGAGAWNAGTSASRLGVVNIVSGATVLINSFNAGSAAGGVGALNIAGGNLVVTNTGDSSFRYGNGGYGSLRVSGGSFTAGNFQLGTASSGIGVALLAGGAHSVPSSYIIVGRAGPGALTVEAGASLDHAGAANQISVAHATGGRGEINLTGGTIDSTGTTVGFGGGTGSSGVGAVSLDAGTLIADRFVHVDGENRLNFGGGTLQASSSSTAFLPADMPVYVNGAFGAFAGGATVDTAGFDDTVEAGLLAPAGEGVSGVEVLDQGSGYYGAPYVMILGDGAGATAIADMADDGSGMGTLKVSAIRITNPGSGYTAEPAVTLTGGVSTVAAVLGAVTRAPNTSGGLTKLGAGTLTLAGANTYTGSTTVAAGTLLLGASGTLSSGTGLVLAGGALNAGTFTNALASLTVTTNSTLEVTAATQLSFISQTAAAWDGLLLLTGELGPTGVRFQSPLTSGQLQHMRYQDGRRIRSTPDGYLMVAPFSTVMYLR